MKKFLTFFGLTMLLSMASAFAQGVHFQPAQRDMMNQMMMLQANPAMPDSSVTFNCETHEKISSRSLKKI
jgi:hypothetical protein